MPQKLPFKKQQPLPQHKPTPLLILHIQDPNFLKCTNLYCQPEFPNKQLYHLQVQYQIHANQIIFTICQQEDRQSQQQECGGGMGLEEEWVRSIGVKVEKIVGEFFSSVCVVRVGNKSIGEEQMWVTVFRLLDFSDCLGYRIVKQPQAGYQTGDILLYYLQQKQPQISTLQQNIKNFSSILIHFPLTPFLHKHPLPHPQLTHQCLSQLLHTHLQQFQSIATLHSLHIFHATISRRSQDYKQKQYCLGFYVQGLLCNLHQFYGAVQYMMESCCMRVVEMGDLRGVKWRELGEDKGKLGYGDGARMVDERTIVVFDRGLGNREWMDMMMGMWILYKQFSEEQKQTLKLQINKQRFKQHMDRNQQYYKSLQFTKNGHIALVCLPSNKTPILNTMRQYCKKFKIQTQQCPQLSSHPLLAPTFFKHYRHILESQFSLQFTYNKDKNTITRKNFTIDTNNIISQIKIIKSQILKQFAYVPSLIGVSKHLAKEYEFQRMYQVEKNPRAFWDRDWRQVRYMMGRVHVMFTGFDNMVRFQENLTCMMHQDLPDYSKVYELAENNKVSIKQFLQGCTGQKPSRARRYPTPQSPKTNSLTLLYFDIKQPSLRHQQQDIRNFLKQNQKQYKINILIGLNSKRFIDEVFGRFLLILNQFINPKDSQNRQAKNKRYNKIQEVWIYYEDGELLSCLERVLINSKFQSTVVGRDIFDNWALLRMNNLKQFILSYYWNKGTYYLPGIDSYIFHHQRSKSNKNRALLSLPTPYEIEQGYHQFYIDFRLRQIHEVLSFSEIQILSYKDVSKKMQNFLTLLQNQFSHLDFFVAYAKNSNDEIAKQISTQICYCSEKSGNCVIPLAFDLQSGKVGIKNGVDKVLFAVVEKNYVDWYKICTHVKQLSTIEKCIER